MEFPGKGSSNEAVSAYVAGAAHTGAQHSQLSQLLVWPYKSYTQPLRVAAPGLEFCAMDGRGESCRWLPAR